MTLRRLVPLTLVALLLPGAAVAQTAEPAYRPNVVVSDINPQPVKTRCWDANAAVWTACAAGGGTSGGGGDASAANQTTQIIAANTTNARLGDVAAPATGSVNQRLSVLDTRLQSVINALGSPLQAGGAVSIAGTLPAFATTPKVDTVIQTTAADRGAIVGTTAVTLIPANPSRRWFSVQNQSGSASCYISGQAAATADYHSLMIGPGALYETPPTHVGTSAVSIICTAASTSVYAREG